MAASELLIMSGLKSPARGTKALDSHPVAPPVIELGPANNNCDRKVTSPVAASPSATLMDQGRGSTGKSPVMAAADTGDPYPYLRFDFSLPPCELARNLVEGLNIPGSARPILMEAPKLPPGWSKKVTVRQGFMYFYFSYNFVYRIDIFRIVNHIQHSSLKLKRCYAHDPWICASPALWITSCIICTFHYLDTVSFLFISSFLHTVFSLCPHFPPE
jgi:hypothetical protein